MRRLTDLSMLVNRIKAFLNSLTLYIMIAIFSKLFCYGNPGAKVEQGPAEIGPAVPSVRRRLPRKGNRITFSLHETERGHQKVDGM